MKKLDTDIFIERAKEIHGDKYDYSSVNYIGANKKVEILCPLHGSFIIDASKHINKKISCQK